MKILHNHKIAEKWVEDYAKSVPGIRGAYVSGSFLQAQAGDDWPESSDIDIVLVFEAGACPPKIGKLRTEGVLLEITCMDEGEFQDLGHVLSTHYLAYALNAGMILYDPSGTLARLHENVKKEYARPEWVEARCEKHYQRIEQSVAGYVPESMTLPHTVNGWAFTTGITCSPILLAGLQNCTVRKRYPAARQVLETYGMGGFYPKLLSLLVPEPLGRERLSVHMKELEKTFALACGRKEPGAPYPFASDISPEGAPVAIGGSWELIEGSHPEDAVFWMLATFARCHILADMEERLPALWAFLRDLGITRREDFARRLEAVRGFLPELREAEKEILRKM